MKQKSIIIALILAISMIMIANFNVALVIINALPVLEFDGEQALSAWLGEDVKEVAKRFLKCKKMRRELLRSGIRGYVRMLVYIIVYLSKIAFAGVIVLNIIGLVSTVMDWL